MKSVSISVTEAARNFAECVNRARYQGTTFVLHKNRVPVARIEPAAEKPSTAGVLAEALAKAELSSEEFADWRRDLAAARSILVPPEDKWQ